jgi:glycerate 2-kinase
MPDRQALRRHYVLAAGKAADAMAAAAVANMHHRGAGLAGGLVIGYPAPNRPDPRVLRDLPDPRDLRSPAVLERVAGGHPVPTAASEDAGRRALALAGSLGPDDHLLVLLSGGASALMAVPAEGLSLDEKRSTTVTLLAAGADIHALNTVRKHLSAIKGGRLAAATRADCDVLAISDVVGDDLSVIASGPAVADASRFQDALEILRRFGGTDRFPRAVVQHVEAGAAGRVAETPKPGDPRLARIRAAVIGSRRDAMDGAVAEASARGYHVVRIDDPIVGEARAAAASYVRTVLALAHGKIAEKIPTALPALPGLPVVNRPLCFVSSGETTVHVKGGGKGGRNQEFVLAAAPLLDQMHAPAALASAGTDGIDGPTDAAGAYADSTTIDRALADGRPPDRFLVNNDSYAFFHALGDLIHTGPTGTNVGDLQVILLA